MHAKEERIQIESFTCVHHKMCSSLRKAIGLKRNQSVAFTHTALNAEVTSNERTNEKKSHYCAHFTFFT